MPEEIYYFYCVNDDCWYSRIERRVPVYRDQEATCPKCGWFMTATPPGGDSD